MCGKKLKDPQHRLDSLSNVGLLDFYLLPNNGSNSASSWCIDINIPFIKKSSHGQFNKGDKNSFNVFESIDMKMIL